MVQVKILYLLVILGICAVTDLKVKKIKNYWTAAGFAGGAVFLVWQGDVSAGKDALFLMLISFGVLFPLYFIRAIGAGDVKLLCMAMLYMEKEGIEVFLAGMLFAGGMIAVVKMVYYGSFRKRMRYFTAYVHRFLLTKAAEEYGVPSEESEVIGMAVPVFIGALGWCLWVYIIK